MREKDLKETGLADMAFKVESDHEVQMARAELYKVAKYAIKMHEMLKGVEEREGLEGWVQSKITKAADYLGSVYHHMDYEMKFEQVSESKKDDKFEPHKMYKDGNGKIEEPTMYNIKGGGEWYDASYHGLLVHRDYEAKTVKAKVLKVKFQNLGENGAEAYFKWEPRSGCFIPHFIENIDEEPMPWET